MTVKFDLSNLENAVRREAERIAKRDGLRIACAHCGYETLMRQGQNICPVCGNTTTLNINFTR